MNVETTKERQTYLLGEALQHLGMIRARLEVLNSDLRNMMDNKPLDTESLRDTYDSAAWGAKALAAALDGLTQRWGPNSKEGSENYV